ncbi:BatD family protein [Aeromonas allosaccharophila]|uniref:BatD family protein n=1 Tax=Aeromonas allosaccharophila TaxID=656 RepID=UPI0013C9BAEE|nr:BatD family protein [Aeromonas allosaccharophila]WDO00642.1 BatD family protein [Aeromonas allosaccharophila]
MRTNYRAPLAITLLLGAMLLPATAAAQERAPAAQVTLKSWLKDQGENNAPYAVNQQITLYLELATNRWFTAGTRIGQFELPGVMVKQRSELATNYTQRRDGETWSHQRWELTLYPQQSGQFEIPAIAVRVTVAQPDGRSQPLTLTTRPQRFAAALPDPTLTVGGRWLSASNLTLSQRWQSSADDQADGELRVGDAITRTVTASGQNTLSVLIPPLIPPLIPAYDNDQRVQAYPAQARLDDTQERGEYLSSREDQTTYIVQRGGELTLPALELRWWNSQTRQLETLTLPGQTLRVRHTPASWLAAYGPGLAAVAGALALLVLMLLAIARYYRHRPRPLGWQYGAAIWRQQWGTVRVLAYRYLRARRGVLELGRVSRDPAWQQQQAAFQQGTLDRDGSLRMGWRLLAHLQRPKGLRGARLRRYIGWRAALPGLATPDGSTTTGNQSASHASASNSATSNSGKKEG